ncbi:sigma-70 family RNA polymerase sigma factor [Brevibacterium sp. CFH 10365]|uniref:sigma-70 family RNA polymerase sigma factor n=1 Tax=Brevibacterium sp. CFH 10365 TaxID=2585207 RepID=UPI0012660C87|nr:sigma-70 family RNA polymerase sigma factor [Brevibacterium sp. CFH 10365]
MEHEYPAIDNAKLSSVIKNVAKKQATDVMDPEDLEQELWVFYLEHVAHRDYPEGAIVDLIKKQGVKVARDERIDYMQFRGAFVYSPAVVRTILEDAVWVDSEDCPDIEGRIDVSRALGELNDDERRVLHQRFAVNPDTRPHFTTLETSRIERAIDKISMILNRGASRSELDIDTASEELAYPAYA